MTLIHFNVGMIYQHDFIPVINIIPADAHIDLPLHIICENGQHAIIPIHKALVTAILPEYFGTLFRYNNCRTCEIVTSRERENHNADNNQMNDGDDQIDYQVDSSYYYRSNATSKPPNYSENFHQPGKIFPMKIPDLRSPKAAAIFLNGLIDQKLLISEKYALDFLVLAEFWEATFLKSAIERFIIDNLSFTLLGPIIYHYRFHQFDREIERYLECGSRILDGQVEDLCSNLSDDTSPVPIICCEDHENKIIYNSSEKIAINNFIVNSKTIVKIRSQKLLHFINNIGIKFTANQIIIILDKIFEASKIEILDQNHGKIDEVKEILELVDFSGFDDAEVLKIYANFLDQ